MGAASGSQPPAGAAQILSTGSVLGRRVYREHLVEPRHADVYPARGVTGRAAAEFREPASLAAAQLDAQDCSPYPDGQARHHRCRPRIGDEAIDVPPVHGRGRHQSPDRHLAAGGDQGGAAPAPYAKRDEVREQDGHEGDVRGLGAVRVGENDAQDGQEAEAG